MITDYGKCCTFNILPYPLLMKDPRQNATAIQNDEAALLNKENWPEAEIDLWKKWKYKDGVTIPKGLKRPYRQHRAGMTYGVKYDLMKLNCDKILVIHLYLSLFI